MRKSDNAGALTSTVTFRKKFQRRCFQMVLNFKLVRGFVCQTNLKGGTTGSKTCPEIADIQNPSRNPPKSKITKMSIMDPLHLSIIETATSMTKTAKEKQALQN